MPFFEPPPPPDPPPPRQRPVWSGPPEGILGGTAALRVVLIRSESMIVVADHFIGYPNGFELSLAIRARPPVNLMAARYPGLPGGRPPSTDGDGLRFGVAFADGRKATSLMPRPPFGTGGNVAASASASSAPGSTSISKSFGGTGGPEPEPPLLIQLGGGGSDGRWDQHYWVWGLPPEGPVGLVVEWRSEAIVETRVDTDSSAIRQAAAEAEVLWTE